MSTLVRDILPWFAGFYLLDALVHLLRGQVVFARLGLERIGMLRSGLRLVGVSPLGLSVVAYELPFLATPRGLWLFDPSAQGAAPVVEAEQLTFVAWEELGAPEAARTTVRAGARVLFKARSPRDAQRLASLLKRLKGLTPEAREEALKQHAAQAFDVAVVRERWRRVRLPRRLAALFGTLETLMLFGALPLLSFSPEADELRWGVAFAVLLGLHLLAVLSAGWTMARWGLSGAERTGALFQMLLLPVYASRAGVQSVREAFSEFEPLIVANVLLAPEDFERVARRERGRIAESLARAVEPELATFFGSRLRLIDEALVKCGTSREQLRARPAFLAPDAVFCPLCLAEYRAGFEACSDCTVALQQGASGDERAA